MLSRSLLAPLPPQGKPLSPIDGIPIGLKDIMRKPSMPTEDGSPLFVGFRSRRDSAGVAALREAPLIKFCASEPAVALPKLGDRFRTTSSGINGCFRRRPRR